MKRICVILCALAFGAASSYGATYYLQPDGSVKAEPEAPAAFAETLADDVICENGVCRVVPSATTVTTSAIPVGDAGTEIHLVGGFAPRFPRLHRLIGRRRVVIPECAPESFAPVPQASAQPMPKGPHPSSVVRVGPHAVDGSLIDRARAAGFSWSFIFEMIVKYGPQILQDILDHLGK
jgi:hypothetical protein